MKSLLKLTLLNVKLYHIILTYLFLLHSRDADDLSDLSENDEEEDDALVASDNSDTETSFYAKTSEELKIIAKNLAAARNVHTDEEIDRRGKVNSRSEKTTSAKSGQSETRRDKVENRRSSTDNAPTANEISKLSHMMDEELVPAEGDDPRFDITIENVTSPLGEPIRLTCRISGTDPIGKTSRKCLLQEIISMVNV